jgi:hypothetical protein
LQPSGIAGISIGFLLFVVLGVLLCKRARKTDHLLEHIDNAMSVDNARRIQTSSTTFRADHMLPTEEYLDIGAKMNPLMQFNNSPQAGFSDAIW